MENITILKNRDEQNYGDLPMIQSETKLGLKFNNISELSALEDGTEVLIRARIHNSRVKGNMGFIVIR